MIFTCRTFPNWVFQLKKLRIIALTATVLFFIFLIISAGLGAILSLSLAIFIFLILKPNPSWTKLGIVWGITAIFFILASFVYSNFFTISKNDNKYLSDFYKPLKNELRFDYVRQAIIGFSHSPIFGTGLDTFRYVSKMYQDEPFNWSWYTHNHYLQLFTETGFFGGLLFFVLIMTLLISVFRKVNHQSSIINHQFHGLLIAVLASTINSLVDYNWQFLSIFLIFSQMFMVV